MFIQLSDRRTFHFNSYQMTFLFYFFVKVQLLLQTKPKQTYNKGPKTNTWTSKKWAKTKHNTTRPTNCCSPNTQTDLQTLDASTATVSAAKTLIRPRPHPLSSISSSDAASYPDLLHKHSHNERIASNSTTETSYRDEVRGNPRTTLPEKADKLEKVVVLETPEPVKTSELDT
ncbi:hypothetical protein C1H46_045178 [Malus baccata]|uniref:Uncharacterized protein n=1 Tax=Malus baccata TaxID=106549 RepID=A0A540K4Z2_MALBA|nr:hypothetical protein C1H46_045178 [Malus baccata]